MNFTFGIITGGSNNHRETITNSEASDRVKKIIKTILDQKIPKYEIIVVGGDNDYSDCENILHIPFNDLKYKGWITRKKNLITQNAQYENIVFMHDYFSLDSEWYKNMVNYSEPFEIMMNQILDINGNRFHDWIIDPFKHPALIENNMETFLPYDIRNMKKLQYASGGFWIAKKHVMENFPLNERLFWGQGEDVEWSNRAFNHHSYSLNENSIVKLLKPRFATGHNMVSEKGMKILQKLSKLQ